MVLFALLQENLLWVFPLEVINFWYILLNRMVMGFVIGTTAIQWKWPIRGIFLGLVVGSILAFSDYIAGYGIIAPIAVKV